MFILYDLIFSGLALITLPIYLFKRKFHPGFIRRLGALPKELNLDSPIWIHAVSVGEALAVKGLVKQLRQIYPGKKLVISTVTPTGNKIARSLAVDGDFVTYLPLDLSYVVNKVIGRVRPFLFVIAETEIWPNIITCLYRNNVPVIIVNGRISDNSYKGYLLLKFLLRPLLNKISLFCVQSQRDARRLKNLGVKPEKIKVTGNMKFDSDDYTDFPAQQAFIQRDPALREKIDHTDLKIKLGVNRNDKILIAGSTHPGEEKIILDSYKDLLKDYPNLGLIIAPRHPDRAADVSSLVNKSGFEPVAISKLSSQTQGIAKKQRVYILDTIGQLVSFYSIADIVFVGGSLVKTGGHNILEPAFLDKPVVSGHYMFNFRDIADLFFDNQAAIKVNNQEELTRAIKCLLDNPRYVIDITQKAKALIRQNQGATSRNAEYIKKLLG